MCFAVHGFRLRRCPNYSDKSSNRASVRNLVWGSCRQPLNNATLRRLGTRCKSIRLQPRKLSVSHVTARRFGRKSVLKVDLGMRRFEDERERVDRQVFA
jgi:hypothetical protein